MKIFLFILSIFFIFASLSFPYDNQNQLILSLENDGFKCGTPEKIAGSDTTWNGDERWNINVLDSNGVVGTYKNIPFYKNILNGKCVFMNNKPIREYEND